MPHPAEPEHPTAAADLATLVGWWIEASCCGRTIAVPCPLLAERIGNITVSATAARLRCRSCGHPPPKLHLTDRADAGGSGGPTTSIRIDLSTRQSSRSPSSTSW